eukprot:g30707.t1
MHLPNHEYPGCPAEAGIQPRPGISTSSGWPGRLPVQSFTHAVTAAADVNPVPGPPNTTTAVGNATAGSESPLTGTIVPQLSSSKE